MAGSGNNSPAYSNLGQSQNYNSAIDPYSKRDATGMMNNRTIESDMHKEVNAGIRRRHKTPQDTVIANGAIQQLSNFKKKDLKIRAD